MALLLTPQRVAGARAAAAAAAPAPAPRPALARQAQPPRQQPCLHQHLSQQPQPQLLARAARPRPQLVAHAAAGDDGPAAPGQVSELMAAMQAKIQADLEADSCVVSDVYGDGRHVSISVVSKAFEGKNAVARQRMVYKAIWLELQEAVHAVDEMSTRTPQEAAA